MIFSKGWEVFVHTYTQSYYGNDYWNSVQSLIDYIAIFSLLNAGLQ